MVHPLAVRVRGDFHGRPTRVFAVDWSIARETAGCYGLEGRGALVETVAVDPQISEDATHEQAGLEVGYGFYEQQGVLLVFDPFSRPVANVSRTGIIGGDDP